MDEEESINFRLSDCINQRSISPHKDGFQQIGMESQETLKSSKMSKKSSVHRDIKKMVEL